MTDGLINGSFKVDAKTSGTFIVQRINESVFPNPNDLMSNHQIISDHLRAKDFSLKGPTWMNTIHGQQLYHFDGSYWRLGDFIEDTQSYDIASDADMAWNVGRAFAQYDQALLDLSPSRLKDTIVSFHHLPRYLNKLQSTLANASTARLSTADKLIQTIDDYTYLAQLPFPKNRVIHNDAKVSNLLFKDHEVCAVIDWDTTMAGHISWEFADLFRTTVVNVPEDHPEVSDLILQFDMLEGLSNGYKSALFDHLTALEKESLYHGALYLIFEQAIRFLEDYLANDVYYTCAYDDHNYIRACNQFRLLSLMVKDKNAIANSIQKS